MSNSNFNHHSTTASPRIRRAITALTVQAEVVEELFAAFDAYPPEGTGLADDGRADDQRLDRAGAHAAQRAPSNEVFLYFEPRGLT